MKQLILIITIVFTGMLFVASCKKNDPVNPVDNVKYIKAIDTKDDDGYHHITEYFYDTEWNIVKYSWRSINNPEYTITSVLERDGNVITRTVMETTLTDTYNYKYQYRYFDDRVETYKYYNGDFLPGDVYLINSSNKIHLVTHRNSIVYKKYTWENDNIVKVETRNYPDTTTFAGFDIEYYSDVKNPFKTLSPFFAYVDMQEYSLMGDNFPKKDDGWDTYTVLTKEGDYPKSYMWSDGTIAEITYY